MHTPIVVTLSRLFLLFLCLMQTACMSATMTGAQAVYNRHSLQKNWEEQTTNMQADQAIYVKTKEFKDTNISVSTFNDAVLIVGQAQTAEESQAIGELVKRVAKNRQVYNYIEIENPISTLTQISDSWITSKVKSQLLLSNDVDPTKIKVITENGTVYLLGEVTPEQSDIAVEIARSTSGVQKVVKIFAYVQINHNV